MGRNGPVMLLVMALGLAAGLVPIRSTDACELRARRFIRVPYLQQAVPNPSGTLVASVQFKKSYHHVVLNRSNAMGDEHGLIVKRSMEPLGRIEWADDRTLLVSAEGRLAGLVRVRGRADDLRARWYDIAEGERVVDPLPLHEDEMLVAVQPKSVHRVSISKAVEASEDDAISFASVTWRWSRVAKHRSAPAAWLADADGEVRVALVTRRQPSPVMQLWHRESGSAGWELLETIEYEPFLGPSLVPIGFAEQKSVLYVLSNRGRDTFAVFEYDTEARSLGELVYGRQSEDVEDVIRNHSGPGLLSAVYYEGGIRRYASLDPQTSRVRRSLSKNFPNESVSIVGRSRDGMRQTFVVESEKRAGSFFFLDRHAGTAELIGEYFPWLHADKRRPTRTVEVMSPDGYRIQAFVTLPEGVGPAPALVQPHGGPLGVSDARTFSASAQYLAAEGVAVVKVNFRGSGGAGRAFLEAGKGEWGRMIESDIDLVVRHLIEEGTIDGRKLCIGGASYGGYSAVISAINYPDRYRCVATLAGVSDLPLLFTSAVRQMSEASRDWLVELVGDPANDYDDLVDRSPVYRVSDLPVPALVAHGTDDLVVDIEHAWRLTRMLELHGKPFRWLPLDGSGHSPAPLARARYFGGLMEFLAEHLELENYSCLQSVWDD